MRGVATTVAGMAAWALAGTVAAQDVAPGAAGAAGALVPATASPPSSGLPASPLPPPIALTLAEAIRRGRADPPSVRLALANAHEGEMLVGVARAAYYPVIAATADGILRYADQPYVPVPGGTPTAFQSAAGQTDGSVTARMLIYDFGQTAHNVMQQRRLWEGLRGDARDAERMAMVGAAVAYLTVLNDMEVVSNVRVTISQREAHLRIAAGQVEAGAQPPITRTRAELDLDSGRLDLATARATELNDRAVLAAALGLDPNTPLELVPVDPNTPTVDDDPVRAGAAAVANRPEFAADRARVAAAEEQLAQLRCSLRPTIAASAAAGATYVGVIQGTTLSGQQEQASGTLTLSVPILNPTILANIRAQSVAVDQAHEALSVESLAERTDAVQNAVAVRSALATLQQAERLAIEATANLDQANGRFQGGAAAILEVVDAEQADEAARITVVRDRLTLQLARVKLLGSINQIAALAQ